MTARYSCRPERGTGLLSALAILALTLLVVPSQADSFSYAASRRQIKACVLVSSAAGSTVNGNFVKENATPHAFYILERRTDLKPAGWEFVNPSAPGTISTNIYNRWRIRGGTADPAFKANTAESVSFRIGGPLTKNMGAYWEVDLDTISTSDLQKYDVALMTTRAKNMNFTPAEREKLRRFLDSGGALWFEDEGGATIGNNPFLVDDLALLPGGGVIPLLIQSQYQHPLVRYPYGFTPIDIIRLGAGGPRGLHTSGMNQLPAVLSTSAGKLLSAGEYGAGHLVISSASIAADVNAFVGGANVVGLGNTGAVSGEVFSNALATDVKFAFNIVSWLSSVPTAGVNSRRSGSTLETIGSHLGVKWASIPVTAASTIFGSGAVVSKGVAYYVDAYNTLHAYQTNPSRDTDFMVDTGIADHQYGSPYDQFWNSNLGYATSGNNAISVSTPTVMNLNGTSGPTGVVAVTSSAGITRAFDSQSGAGLWSFSGSGSGNINGSLLNLGNNMALPSPSPVFSDGILFAAAQNSTSQDTVRSWRIAPINPLTGHSVFGDDAQGVGPTPRSDTMGLYPIIGSPSSAYIRDESTGGLDQVIFVPTRNSGGQQIGDTVTGLWFRTRGEQLVQFDNVTDAHTQFRSPSPERRKVPWWAPASLPGNADASLLPVVRIVRGDGTLQTLRWTTSGSPFTVDFVGTTGAREMNLTLTSGNALKDVDQLYVDYTLDWSGAAVGSSGNLVNLEAQRMFEYRRFITYNPQLAGNTQNTFLNGGVAVSPQDDVLFTVYDNRSDNSGGLKAPDRVYAYRDQYPSSAQLAQSSQVGTGGTGGRIHWMWAPFNAQNFPAANGMPAQSLSARLISSQANVINGAITNFRAVGTPSVTRDGLVYVVGTSDQGAVVLALNSSPTLTFSLNQTFDTGATVIVQQYNPQISVGGAAGPLQLTEANGNLTFDRQNGTVTLIDCRDKNTGDTLNVAMPFFVTFTFIDSSTGSSTTTTQALQTSDGRSVIDNLSWWQLIPADTGVAAGKSLPSSGATVVGDTLYYGTVGSEIVALDLASIQKDRNTTTSGQKPAYKGGNLNQPYFSYRPALADPLTGAPAGRPIINAPLATTGTLFVGAGNGISALDNRLTLIAEKSRLIEVDYKGNATWTSDATRADIGVNDFTVGQVPSIKIPLLRPSMASRVSLSNILVADTGNNRVVEIDRGGNSVVELQSFNDDMHFTRPGEPLSLNQPTDVQTFPVLGSSLSITNASTGVSYSYTGFYFSRHYVIADSGNYRIVEVVDALGPNGQPIVMVGSDGSTITMQKQIVFVTRSSAEQNGRFRYRTIQQFLDLDQQGNLQPYLVAAVDNLRQAPRDPATVARGTIGNDGPGGSLVFIQRYGAKDGATVEISSSFVIPSQRGNINIGGSNPPLKRQPLSNPTWTRRYAIPDPNNATSRLSRYLVADDNGVYVLAPSLVNGLPELVVEWMLTSQDYMALTGRPLKAASIVKLNQADFDSGTGRFWPRFLITNAYSGPVSGIASLNGVNGGVVNGEVFEIRSIDYLRQSGNLTYLPYQDAGLSFYLNGVPYNTASPLVWIVPQERVVNGQVRRSIGSGDGGSSTFLLDQPAFSDRPL